MATFNEFTLAKDKQNVSVTGKIGLKDNMDLHVKAVAVELANFNDLTMPIFRFDGKADAQISAQGPLGSPFLSGNITLLKSDVYIPSSGNTQSHEIEVIEKGAKTKISPVKVKHAPGIIDSLGMNIDLSIPGNSWVHWDEGGLNTEIKGDLNFKKTSHDPLIFSGEIDTVRGSFKYLGKTISIDEGSLIFSGGKPGDAQLNVKSSKQFPNIIITISVSGTLNSPILNLSSIPDADQADIISYLMFGKPSNKLNEAEEGSLANLPLNVLGNIASQGLRNILGNQLAPEVIEINPVAGGTIGVGKYITNKLFIKYEWTLNYDETYQSIIDYQLSQHFTLHSQTGNNKTSGLDLFWNYSY